MTASTGQFPWHDVPPEYEREWVQIFYTSLEGLDLASPCPVCGACTLHRWYWPGERVDKLIDGRHYVARGSEWEWCSTCYSYVHYSAYVPAWWSCDMEIDPSVLGHAPEAIERARQEQARHSNGASGNPDDGSVPSSNS